MPEGPEIRLAADRVADAVTNKRLTRVFFGLPRLKRFQRQLKGERVTAVHTRGKAMLTRFSNGLTLYSHNQLYGRWYLTGGEMPSTNRSLRVGLFTDAGCALLYSASDVDVLDDAQVAEHPFLARLGPDVLDPATTPAVVRRQLESARYARRSLAALYLDILFTAYNDQNMVLAEYNGGPLNAGYYRAGSSRAATETTDYVRKVGTLYEGLKDRFELGVEVTLEQMHRDRDRDGKLLGSSPHRRTPARRQVTADADADAGQ